MRTKDRYLKLRGKTWYFIRPIPVDLRDEYPFPKIERSTKQRDIELARRVRDRINRELELDFMARRAGKGSAVADTTFEEQARSEARFNQTAGEDGFTPMLDGIYDRIDTLAARKLPRGSLEAFDEARDWVIAHTEEGRAAKRELDAYNAALNYRSLGREYLAQRPDLKRKTVAEYQRAFQLAEGALPPIRETKREHVQRWVRDLAQTLSKPQIRKHLGALRGLVKAQGLDPAPFTDLFIPDVRKAKEREIWTPQELKELFDRCQYPWLRDVMLIALHTGARADAIHSMQYLAEKDWIRFGKAKREKADRYIPCHSLIRPAVQRWVAQPRSTSSISGRFGDLKRVCGFDTEENRNVKVFHSFRHQVASKLRDLEVPYEKIVSIIGHKPQDMTFGTYGDKTDPETLRPFVERLCYPELAEFTEKR